MFVILEQVLFNHDGYCFILIHFVNLNKHGTCKVHWFWLQHCCDSKFAESRSFFVLIMQTGSCKVFLFFPIISLQNLEENSRAMRCDFIHNCSALSLDKTTLWALSLSPRLCTPRHHVDQLDLKIQIETLYAQLEHLTPSSSFCVEILLSASHVFDPKQPTSIQSKS